jgi:hypothetical protein
MKKKKRNKQDQLEDEVFTPARLKARLDAIIMLLAQQKYSDEEGALKIGAVAKLLHGAGFGPTEIARFFGKTKATEVSQYLY